MKGLISLALISWLCTQQNYIIAQVKSSQHAPQLSPVFLDSNIQNLKYNGEKKIFNELLGLGDEENLYLDIHQGKLYINVNGTGILYCIDSNRHFARIDSTKYQGHNFGSAFFTYDNGIFNAGGYGFWELSGSIRYFDTLTSEWSAIFTQKNIPFANGKNSISFVDKKAGLLYVLYVDYEPEYVTQRSVKDRVKLQCFNLKTQKWWDNSYYINSEDIETLDDIYFIHYTKNGILINIKKQKNTYELSFSDKSFYKINSEFITRLFQVKGRFKNYLSYNIDDTLKFFDCQNNISNSLILDQKLKVKDTLITLKVEDESYKSSIKNYLFIFTIIILLIVNYLQFRFKKRTKIEMLNIEKTALNSTYQFKEILEINEVVVLNLIISNSELGKMTSVEELNNILGLKEKSYKIQNNIRADVINAINKKFILSTKMNDILIERKRTDFDKRYFEYYINKKYLSKVKAYIR